MPGRKAGWRTIECAKRLPSARAAAGGARSSNLRPLAPIERSPLLKVYGKDIRVQGKLIRIARLDGDKYHFLDDPEPMLDGLRRAGIRIHVFTFFQRLTV